MITAILIDFQPDNEWQSVNLLMNGKVPQF